MYGTCSRANLIFVSVKRISDLPVGGFIVSNNEIIDVKFTYNWKNADGIEKLDAPTSKDRYGLYAPGNVIDKSELEIIIPTPSEITILDGESSLKSEYKVFVDESLNLDINTVKSLFVENFNVDIKNSKDYDISVQYIDNLLEESYKLSIDENKISIEASGRAGALYGLQSLKQLFLASSLENKMLKHMNISDSSYPDIYISNDFSSPDFMYMNNGDGTFTDIVKESTNQTSFYGMGVDIADFNNDQYLDYIQVDMDAKDNRRSKANMASMNPDLFWSTVNYGFHYQYIQ